MDLNRAGRRMSLNYERIPAPERSSEQGPSPTAWASHERARYTKLFQELPKIKTIKGKPFADDKTEDVLGIPLFVDRAIQICEDCLAGCLTRELAAQAFERLVKSARSYSVPWNLVGHVLESATQAFPEVTEIVRLQSWARKMNKLGSL